MTARLIPEGNTEYGTVIVTVDDIKGSVWPLADHRLGVTTDDVVLADGIRTVDSTEELVESGNDGGKCDHRAGDHRNQDMHIRAV